MIETTKSKDGHIVVKFDGRNLASTYEPEGEAIKWVSKHKSLIHGVRTVFVLGAGSGYHIAALRSQFPSLKIVVYDPRQALIREIKKHWSFDLLEIHFINSIDEIVDKHIASSFLSLRHISSWYGFEKEFLDIERYLTGRFDIGFQKQLELRAELKNLLNDVEKNDERTILDLIDAVKPEVKAEKSVHYLYAIAELLK